MPDVDALAILVGAAAAFVIGSTCYSVVGGPGGETPPWKLAVEVLRCLVLAAVIAGLAARGEVDDIVGGLLLGLALWVGFPLVLWTGAIVWEGTRPRQAALHAGDWLVKLLAAAAIVSAWQ
jgi:Protein of unknown function (DUF1761)